MRLAPALSVRRRWFTGGAGGRVSSWTRGGRRLVVCRQRRRYLKHLAGRVDRRTLPGRNRPADGLCARPRNPASNGRNRRPATYRRIVIAEGVIDAPRGHAVARWLHQSPVHWSSRKNPVQPRKTRAMGSLRLPASPTPTLLVLIWIPERPRPRCTGPLWAPGPRYSQQLCLRVRRGRPSVWNRCSADKRVIILGCSSSRTGAASRCPRPSSSSDSSIRLPARWERRG